MTRPRSLALARTASMDMDPIPMDWTDARTRGDDAHAAVGFCLEPEKTSSTTGTARDGDNTGSQVTALLAQWYY